MPERRNVFEVCEAADLEVRSGPHAWIQWKGTGVCMDVWCSCGVMTHVDAEFAYYVECGACGKYWAMCANVRMIEVSKEETSSVCGAIVSEL